MGEEPIRILLVEDNPGDARLLRETLREAEGLSSELTQAERLAEAIKCLQGKAFDIVLLDLSLPDSDGSETVKRIITASRHIPVVVLTGTDDAAMGTEAVRCGAQDYLVKGQTDHEQLTRAVRYAIERYGVEEALRESEARFRAIASSTPDHILMQDRDLRYLFVVNPQLGLTEHEMIGKTDHDFLASQDADRLTQIKRQVMETGKPVQLEMPLASAGGEKQFFSGCYVPRFTGEGVIDGVIGYFQNITERIKREQDLHRLNRTLRAMSQSDQAMIRATDELQYVREVCAIVVRDCGHAMAWVGYARRQDEDKTVEPVAHAGREEGYLQGARISWDETERGLGPTGTAIRTGQATICNNMLTDPRVGPWRQEASKRGYASSIALPLHADGEVFGALTIYSGEPAPFADEEVTLLAELAGDLAHGISVIRIRDAHAKTTEALRFSEERYRNLVDVSPNALYINRGGRIEFANPAALRLFGASAPEQLLGKSPYDLYPVEFHAGIRERMDRLRSGERLMHSEHKALRLDGATVDVEELASPFTDREGPAVQVILWDISQRKQSEAALLDSLRRFELLAGTAGELLVAPEHQNAVQAVCRHVMEQLGCCISVNFLVDDKSGRLRLNASVGLSPEHARQIEWLDLGTAVCGCVARDGCRIVAEHIPTTDDPRTDLVKSLGIKAYACHPLLGPGGRIIGTLSFGTCLSETFSPHDLSLMKAVADQVAAAMIRTQSEETLRVRMAALDAAAEGVVITDPAGSIEYVNPAFTAVSGYSIQEAIGCRPGELVKSGVHDSAFYRNLWDTILSGKAWRGDLVNRRKDGTVYPEEMTITPVVGSQGQIKNFIAIKRDITQRKQAEDLLQQAKAELEQRVAERTSELAAANAGLRAQMGAYERLEAEIAKLVEDERMYLGMELHDNLCQQLAAAGMLTSSLARRLRDGGSPLAEQAVRIGATLSQTGADAHKMARGLLPVQIEPAGLMMALASLVEQTRQMQGVACAFECAAPVPVENSTTATHLFRIAQEAIHNAIKHGHARQIVVSLYDQPGVKLTVLDDGVGIAPDSHRGAGSGLRIMAHRARVIGAELSVGPSEGGGTRVQCILSKGVSEPCPEQKAS